MKKLVLSAVAAVICAASMFAFDLGDFPKGTWTDSKWNAEWIFGLNSIQLKDSQSGEVIYDFSQDKITDLKLTPSAKEGLTLTFSCAETHRAYAFTKPVSLSTSLNMKINPDWTDEDYIVTIPFKK